MKNKKVYSLFYLLFTIYCLLFTVCCAMDSKGSVKGTAVESSGQDDQYFWDFGKVEKNIVLNHKFVLKNESKTVLNIDNVTTSCGCIVSEVKQKSLKPGESTTIKVKLDTKGYSGMIKQFVYVNTDSHENALVKYTVQAEAMP